MVNEQISDAQGTDCDIRVRHTLRYPWYSCQVVRHSPFTAIFQNHAQCFYFRQRAMSTVFLAEVVAKRLKSCQSCFSRVTWGGHPIALFHLPGVAGHRSSQDRRAALTRGRGGKKTALDTAPHGRQERRIRSLCRQCRQMAVRTGGGSCSQGRSRIKLPVSYRLPSGHQRGLQRRQTGRIRRVRRVDVRRVLLDPGSGKRWAHFPSTRVRWELDQFDALPVTPAYDGQALAVCRPPIPVSATTRIVNSSREATSLPQPRARQRERRYTEKIHGSHNVAALSAHIVLRASKWPLP